MSIGYGGGYSSGGYGHSSGGYGHGGKNHEMNLKFNHTNKLKQFEDQQRVLFLPIMAHIIYLFAHNYKACD